MRKSSKIEFEKGERFSPRNERERRLIKAFAAMKTEEDAANLIRDILTPVEIEEFANRFEIARQLKQGHPYLQIANELGTSTTTVTRVAHWLFNGCGGYWKALKQLTTL